MAKDQPVLTIESVARGGYVARLAVSDADVAACQRLRHLCFVEAAQLPTRAGGLDADGFDAACDHVLVEDATGRLVCCYRMQVFGSLGAMQQGYTGQFYDLSDLDVPGPYVELGRFCVAPNVIDADVVRLAWGMLARIVDARGGKLLFGCSSFSGVDAQAYADCFDLLAARHVSGTVGVKAAEVLEFAANAGPLKDRRAALAKVPPLLRTYLSMGGWVSDHAVIDRDMNTLHVFTGVEIDRVPPARAAALRAVAAP
ncbi:GNAT family N-acetyltransferase [Pseudooctadecabacter sp.]|uniref:GNAT family N-acetyltransferase n=1 Tax=Pseudooctadecabacter sp. TaxID=1966338 RepID=UPI0035C85A11